MWISVKDRLPEKTGSFLVTRAFDNSGDRAYAVATFTKWTDNCHAWCIEEDGDQLEVSDTLTHWMPIPEVPGD